MGKLIWALIAIAVVVLGGGYVNRIQCLSDDGPQMAVLGYLSAMKDERFEDAYPFVTASMTDGKPVAAWAAQQRRMYDLGAVKINELDVRSGHRNLKNIFTCAGSARVPNVLHATDVFNSQGSTEFEVYSVVMEDGVWKIDSQETLFDETAIKQWFPEDKMLETDDAGELPPAN